MIKAPPRTIWDVFQSLPEGTLCQLINNQLITLPSPTPDHQKITRNIFRQLDQFVVKNNLGEVLFAPLDVYFDNYNIFQPDIIFISKERLNIVQEKIKGAPDLLFEVLSPGTEKFDKKDKKDVYEQYGVKEYWMVDHATKNVFGYESANGQFIEIPSASGIIQSRLLDITINI